MNNNKAMEMMGSKIKQDTFILSLHLPCFPSSDKSNPTKAKHVFRLIDFASFSSMVRMWMIINGILTPMFFFISASPLKTKGNLDEFTFPPHNHGSVENGCI